MMAIGKQVAKIKAGCVGEISQVFRCFLNAFKQDTWAHYRNWIPSPFSCFVWHCCMSSQYDVGRFTAVYSMSRPTVSIFRRQAMNQGWGCSTQVLIFHKTLALHYSLLPRFYVSFMYTDLLFIYIFSTEHYYMQSNDVIMFLFSNIIYLLNLSYLLNVTHLV